MPLEIPSGEASTTRKSGKKSNASEKIDKQKQKVEKAKKKEKLEDLKEENEEGKEEGENGEGKEEEEKGCCKGRSMRTRIIQAIALLCILVNGAAIGIEFTYVVMLAGAIAIIIAPFVMFLEMQLRNTDTMTTVQNALRKDVNKFQDENNKLTAEIDVLEEELAELQEQEKRLEEIAAAQGTTVDHFVGLVKENKLLLEKQEAVVRNETAQLLSSVVITADGDCDGNFSEVEVQKLEARLNAVPGLKINRRALHRSLRKSGNSMGNLLTLVNRLTMKDEKSKVFKIVEEGRSDHESDFSEDERSSASLSGRIERIDDEKKEEPMLGAESGSGEELLFDHGRVQENV